LFVVNPDAGEIVADVIAEDTFDEVEVAVQKRRSLAVVVLALDLVPGFAEELDVGANFVIGGAAGRGAHDEAAGIAAASFADQAAEARAVFGAGNLARNADVVDGRHVHQETAGKRDVTCDARALLAQRFLGDLHDDILACLQHFRNQLRPARRSVSAVMSAMRAVAAAGATLEASPTAVWSAITSPIRATICAPVTVAAATEGAVGTSLGASAASAETAAIAAAVASAALRALETGTRVGADAGKILSRRAGIARPTSFPWQENNVFFDDGFDCGAIRSGSRKRFRRDVLDGFVVSEVGAFGFGQLRAVFRVGPCFAALL